MIGKIRIAAKVMGLTSVLATGGGGAYYYTTGGAAPWAYFSKQDATATAQLKPDNAADGNLDAVASAWADSTAPRSATRVSSVQARSADSATTRAANNSSAVGSRYEQISSDPTAAAKTVVAPNNSDSTPNIGADPPANDITQNAEKLDRYSAAATEGAPAEGWSVVRGQSPNDAAVPVGDIAPLTGSSGSNALRLPDEPPVAAAPSGLNAAATRARQAFTDPSPAAPVAQAAPGGDRYRAAAAEPRKGDAAAPENGARLNPFATPSAQMPAANSAQPLPNAALSLPVAQGGGIVTGDGFPESGLPAAAGAYERPADAGRLSPAGYGNSPNAMSAGQQRTAAGSSFGSMPSGGLLPGMGAAGEIGGSGAEGTGKPGERALEGAQNPALLIQKQAPPEIQVGKPAKFLIQVRNMGSQAAADVVVRDEVPQGTRLVSASPNAEMAGGQLMWRIGTLSVGEERTIELQLMPTAEGEIGSVATVSYSAQASIKTRSTMPQLAIKMTAPKQVMVGQEQRIKILLNNPGSGDATGVMLLENVPENVRHAAGPALEFEVGTLRAGETRELELVLLAQKAGKVANVLSAKADGNLQVQQQVDFEVIAPALTVAVVGPERRYLERPATYQVRVENPGTATARDIQLVTKLPRGMKFVRANNMGEYDAGTHAVYWSLAELPEKEKGSVELVAMPIETGPQTLEVEGRAQQGLSDQTKQQIMVEGLAAIMFEVRDLEDPIELGRETAYEIRIVNQGTKAATNVQVAVTLPPGMQYVSADGETKHAAQAGGLIFAPIKQLGPKVDSIFRVKVKGNTPGDQRIIVEVKTDDMTNPIRREESTRVFGDD